MKSNNIPDNMGKKIAEALKNQDFDLSADDSLSLDDMGELVLLDSEESIDDAKSAPKKQAEPMPTPVPKVEKLREVEIEKPKSSSTFGIKLDDYDTPSNEEKFVSSSAKESTIKINAENSDVPEMKLALELEDDEEDLEEFEMPNNINVLKRLILQLPAGVPKPTGAMIIRQTIEALGIPMKSVLQDAGRVRDCLNSSIKDCQFTIQEYKSNIKNLEKQVASYQKQLTKLNDIIGLFVYNDKK